MKYLNSRIDASLQAFKNSLIVRLENYLGRKISYGSISPSIFRYFEIRNLEIYGTSSEEPVVKINKIKVYYSISKLFRTHNPTASLIKVNVSNSQFYIDASRDRELIEIVQKLLAGTGDNGKGINFLIPVITGSNISISLRTNNYLLMLKKLFFNIKNLEKEIQLDIRGKTYANIWTPGQRKFTLNSKVKLSGRIDSTFEWSQLRVRLYAVKSNLFSLPKQTFQLRLKDNEITVQKIQDKNLFDVQLRYNIPKRVAELHLISEKFRPISMVKLSGDYKKYNKWLSSAFSTKATLKYDFTNKHLSYIVDLKSNIQSNRYIPKIYVSSHFSGNEREVFFEPFIARSELGTVEFFGNVLYENYLPSGLLNLTDIHIARNNDLNASFKLTRFNKNIVMHSDKLIIGSAVFKKLDIDIKPGLENIPFKLNAVLENTNQDSIANAEGILKLKPKLFLEAKAEFKDLLPERIIAVAGTDTSLQRNLIDILSKVKLSTSLKIKTDFKTLDMSSESVVLRGRKNHKNYVNFAFVYEKDRLKVKSLNGHIGRNIFTGRLDGEIKSANKVEFQIALLLNGFYYSLNGRYIPDLGMLVNGNYGLSISLLRRVGGPVNLELAVNNFPIPVRERNILTSGKVEGSFKNSKDWYIKSRDLTVNNIEFLKSKKNSIKATLSINPGKVKISSIQFKDSFSSVAGEGNIDFSMEKRYSASGWLLLQNKASRESYQVKTEIEGEKLSADINFSSMPLERLGTFNITGSASGTLKLTDVLSNTKAELSLALEKGRLNADPLSFSISSEYSNEKVKIHSMEVGYLSHKLTDSYGVLDIKKGTFTFLSNYRATYFKDTKVNLIIGIDARLAHFNSAEGSASFLKNLFNQKLQGKAEFSSIKVNGESFNSWDLRVKVENKILTFDGGPGDTIHGLVDGQGNFKILSLDPFPIVMDAEGTINNNRINSNADIKKFDISVLSLPLKSKAIIFKSGTARGTLHITGAVNDPDITGKIDVTDGKAESMFTPLTIEPLSTLLTFTGKGFSMEKLTTYVAKRPLVAYGDFLLDHWFPYAFNLTFESTNPNGVKFAYNFGPIIVDGYVNGKIHVVGDNLETKVDGNLTANYCKIALGEKKPKKENGNEEIVPTIVNLKVNTGKRVEFYWPSLNFPILRAFTDVGNLVRIVYNENDGSYSVKGDVGIQGGEVFYFDRSFYLKEGLISFNENQEDFDPRVKILAEIREQDEKGEEVKIYLNADNKLSQFSPRFYSDPSKSDVEIMSMIGGSIFGKAQEQGIGVSAVMLTSELVSQFGILRPFERAVRDYLGLDLFSIRTQVIQNLILEKILGNVTNPLDNTTLSLGKYLGNDLFLEMLVRLKTMALPSSDIYYFSGITSDVEINLEWTTPFFLMEWSLIPKHPEDLFLSDNSLTLKWRYSY